MLTRHDGIEATRAAFRWHIPARYNMGVDVSDRVARLYPDRLAVLAIDPDGAETRITFTELARQSNRWAHLLARDAGPGHRVAVLLPQRIETALAHVAVWKLGAISIPLFVQFGTEALAYRLRDAGARIVVTDPEGAAKLRAIRADLPDLKRIVVIGDETAAELRNMPDSFTPADTAADDPALIIYTSGTTGPPKGALHAHRVLLGHLPGVEMSHDFLPQPGDLIWTPADWAWIGGLLDVLLPALHHGVPVLACRFARFTADAAFDLMERYGVRNAFLPPTALRMMRRDAPHRHWPLRSVAAGGEPLGAALQDWAREAFGRPVNEFYGQTECNMIVSSCEALATVRPGIMGWPVPGHEVAILDGATGQRCDDGEEGDIAVATPNPVMFLRYWNNPDATERKFITDPDGTRWLLTGDRGVLTQGQVRFVGRDDDVIASAGYRIGPAEIEDCLSRHPAVAQAGVIGVPDATRGHVVMACLVLADGHNGDETLENKLFRFVAEHLAPYEAPRRFTFLERLPMTTTGKIMRAELRRRFAG